MYWKQILNVPKGIRYLSQWEYNFLSRPQFQGHCILHKQLPGCGFTELVLTGPEWEVLSSPRRVLMQNKKDQHGDDVFLVVNDYESPEEIDEDITKDETAVSLERKDKYEENRLKLFIEKGEDFYKDLYFKISDYIQRITSEGKPPKIIVTYDSTSLVKDILTELGCLDRFHFVVDEFQSILEDSRFKAEVETEFLSILQSIPNVMFVSATPMLDKYIAQIEELNTIPYFQLDWEAEDKTRIKRPDLKVRTMSSIASKMESIIQSYLDGNFESRIVERDGQLIQVTSTEAVFYVNSVNHIINIIKRMGLSPDQVNILCSDTPENQRKIEKKLGKRSGFKIGSVPLRGESHKMFTMCTRTVYLGADFYSTNARSFIFSDSNADCLSVDISLDLAQILGRQRLLENPWHNSAEFYYRTTCDYKKMTWEDLKGIINVKTEKTNDVLRGWSGMDEKAQITHSEIYQREARSHKYKSNYISVNRKLIKGKMIPVFNNLVRINEERTFDIQQVDYADRFAVFCSMDREFNSIGFENERVKSFFSVYDSIDTYLEKLKYICEYLIDSPEMSPSIIGVLSDSDRIKEQLIVLGPERIKGLSYSITRIKQAMGVTIFDKSTFLGEIYKNFIPGNKYTKKFIKEKLSEIYSSSDFKGVAKANHLEEWFELKPCKITNEMGIRDHGFEIISVK